MSKLYCVTAIFLFGVFSSFGQSFVCSPANSLTDIAPLNSYTHFNIDMVNQTADTMTLGWTMLENTLHADWDYSLCDYTNCYTIIPPTGIMTPNFTFTTNSFLKLTLNPMNTLATGTIRFFVYNVNNPGTTDTVTFVINSTATVGLNEAEATKGLIYPNPASNFLGIDASVREIEIYNFAGMKVFATSLSPQDQKISIEGLDNGLHMVRMTLGDKSVVTNKIFIEN